MKIRGFQKGLAFFLSVVLTLGTAAVAAGATQFNDVPGSHWASENISGASEKGIIYGRGEGVFDPNSTITRQEFLQMVDNLFKNTKNAPTVPSDANTSYRSAIGKALYMGYITADADGKVRPTEDITRVDAATVLANAFTLDGTTKNLTFYDIRGLTQAQMNAVGALKAKGIVSGFEDGSFRPQDTLTRAQAARMFDLLVVAALGKGTATQTDVSASGNAIVVNQEGAVLENITTDSKTDVIITSGVGEGDVTFKNVTINGRLIIEGGGSNSVRFMGNTTINNILAKKNNNEPPVNLFFEKNASAGNIDAETGFFLSGEGQAENLNIKGNNVTGGIRGNMNVGSLNIGSGAQNTNINLTDGGHVGMLNNNGSGSRLNGTNMPNGETGNVDNKTAGTSTTSGTVNTDTTGSSSGSTGRNRSSSGGGTTTTMITIASVNINTNDPEVGVPITATTKDSKGNAIQTGVNYQWYYTAEPEQTIDCEIGDDPLIHWVALTGNGATTATYTPQKDDIDMYLMVRATGNNVVTTGVAAAKTDVPVLKRPVVSSATITAKVARNKLVVEFDEDVDMDGVTGLSITGGKPAITINSYNLSGHLLTITLDRAVDGIENLTFVYGSGNTIVNADYGNALASGSKPIEFTAETITTVPRTWSNSVSPNHNQIGYDEGSTGDRQYTGDSGVSTVGVATTVMLATAKDGKIPYYYNDEDPTNMIGFSLTVPEGFDKMSSRIVSYAYPRDPLNPEMVEWFEYSRTTGLGWDGSGWVSDEESVRDGDELQGGGIAWIYPRPQLSAEWKYVYTWSDSKGNIRDFTETIFIDMTDPDFTRELFSGAVKAGEGDAFVDAITGDVITIESGKKYIATDGETTWGVYADGELVDDTPEALTGTKIYGALGQVYTVSEYIAIYGANLEDVEVQYWETGAGQPDIVKDMTSVTTVGDPITNATEYDFDPTTGTLTLMVAPDSSEAGYNSCQFGVYLNLGSNILGPKGSSTFEWNEYIGEFLTPGRFSLVAYYLTDDNKWKAYKNSDDGDNSVFALFDYGTATPVQQGSIAEGRQELNIRNQVESRTFIFTGHDKTKIKLNVNVISAGSAFAETSGSDGEGGGTGDGGTGDGDTGDGDTGDGDTGDGGTGDGGAGDGGTGDGDNTDGD